MYHWGRIAILGNVARVNRRAGQSSEKLLVPADSMLKDMMGGVS